MKKSIRTSIKENFIVDIMNRMIFLIGIFMMIGCGKKREPLVKIDANLSTPLVCMSLNDVGIEKMFTQKLHSLYTFDKACDVSLFVKYKKDIVCNSPYNPNSKNVSQSPKSFLKLELRRGFNIVYSYYIDLYKNVDEEDVEDAFKRLEKDLIQANGNDENKT